VSLQSLMTDLQMHLRLLTKKELKSGNKSNGDSLKLLELLVMMTALIIKAQIFTH